jgi:hypothetical protein
MSHEDSKNTIQRNVNLIVTPNYYRSKQVKIRLNGRNFLSKCQKKQLSFHVVIFTEYQILFSL